MSGLDFVGVWKITGPCAWAPSGRSTTYTTEQPCADDIPAGGTAERVFALVGPLEEFDAMTARLQPRPSSPFTSTQESRNGD